MSLDHPDMLKPFAAGGDTGLDLGEKEEDWLNEKRIQCCGCTDLGGSCHKCAACCVAFERRNILCCGGCLKNKCSDTCCCSEERDDPLLYSIKIMILLREIAILCIFYGIYSIGRDMSGWFYSDLEDTAIANGDSIAYFEEDIGVFLEKTWQDSVIDTDWIYFFIYFYSFGTGVVMTPILFCIMLWHKPHYYSFARTWFWVGSLMGVATWAVFPVAPPRMISWTGVVDAVEEIGGIFLYSSLANVYAAFPSMHVGWATEMGVMYNYWLWKGDWSLYAKIPCSVLITAYPFVTWVATVVTGYHWVIDGIAGAMYMGVAFLLARYAFGTCGYVNYETLVGENEMPFEQYLAGEEPVYKDDENTEFLAEPDMMAA